MIYNTLNIEFSNLNHSLIVLILSLFIHFFQIPFGQLCFLSPAPSYHISFFLFQIPVFLVYLVSPWVVVTIGKMLFHCHFNHYPLTAFFTICNSANFCAICKHVNKPICSFLPQNLTLIYYPVSVLMWNTTSGCYPPFHLLPRAHMLFSRLTSGMLSKAFIKGEWGDFDWPRKSRTA